MTAITNNKLTDAQALDAAIKASLQDGKKEKSPKAKKDEKVTEAAKTPVSKAQNQKDEDKDLLEALKQSEISYKKENEKAKSENSGKNEKSEAASSTPASAKKAAKLLTPTTGEEWTKSKFGFGAKLALKACKATVLKSVVANAMKKNGNELTPELWAKIDGVKIDSVNTCGDAEKHAVEIINWFEKEEDAREYTHDILKEVLQSYARKGIGVITDIKKITDEAQARAAERSKAKEASAKEANAKAQKA